MAGTTGTATLQDSTLSARSCSWHRVGGWGKGPVTLPGCTTMFSRYGLVPPHVQTLSNGRAIMGEGHCFTDVGAVNAIHCFHWLVDPPMSDKKSACWIIIRHGTVSAGDVNMCILP